MKELILALKGDGRGSV